MAWAATTYYVDTSNSKASDNNPGSQALTWKTIGKTSAAMVAGDTAMVLAGTFNEWVSSKRSGTSASRITFKASGVVNISGGGNINHDYITILDFQKINSLKRKNSFEDILIPSS